MCTQEPIIAVHSPRSTHRRSHSSFSPHDITGQQTTAAPSTAPAAACSPCDGVSVPVSITHHGDDLLLVILDGAGEFVAGPLDVLTLESAGARGIVRTPGSAELIEANLLRFTLDETAGTGAAARVRQRHCRQAHHPRGRGGEVLAERTDRRHQRRRAAGAACRNADLPGRRGSIYFSLYLGVTDYDDQVNGTVRDHPPQAEDSQVGARLRAHLADRTRSA